MIMTSGLIVFSKHPFILGAWQEVVKGSCSPGKQEALNHQTWSLYVGSWYGNLTTGNASSVLLA